MQANLSRPDHCPRASQTTWIEVDRESGEIRPPMCKANLCPYCGRVKRWQIARAVGAANPVAFLTLTLAGDEWSVIQKRMNKMIEHLRSQGHDFEWAWKVECNSADLPSGPIADHQHHVHAYVRGDVVPDKQAFKAEAQKVGFGSAFRYTALTHQVHRAPRYLWGPKKDFELGTFWLAHVLAMNGGRWVHPSRGFWRVDGVPVGGMQEAIRLSRRWGHDASPPGFMRTTSG